MRARAMSRSRRAAEGQDGVLSPRSGRPRAVLAVAIVPVAALIAWGEPSLGTADVGAPWLSLEIPANPLDEAHGDAVAVVRTYYHERPVEFELQGTAEGVVDGERRSVPLEFDRTGQRGATAVRRTWPDEGEWTLVIGVEGAPTTLVAELGPEGGVTRGAYYGQRVHTLVARSIDVQAERRSEVAARVRARLDAPAARGR